ncbi:hypothetical protein [Chryseobacterium gossypii]|uniref:hypothetical protein n=1 Tax=Chryseobacterium gossypii TaxID=3231602 RepID=UPI003525CBA9
MLKPGLIFLLFCCFVVKAQEIIPFRITKHNNIIVKTLVNDRDSLDLMFQIAMEDASVSPERQRKADHIIFRDGISENNTIKAGKLIRNNIRFFDNELTGHEADGKVGTGIFTGKVFKIDYDGSQFVIYDQLPDVTDYRKVPLFSDRGQLFIDGISIINGTRQETRLLLQSGYSGGLLYSNRFADEKGLGEKLEITGEKVLKNSSGQSVITRQGILPYFDLAGLVLKNVSAGFFAGDLKTQKVSYFGADLLRRFNWIFDAERQTAYIKPSRYFTEPYYKIN